MGASLLALAKSIYYNFVHAFTILFMHLMFSSLDNEN